MIRSFLSEFLDLFLQWSFKITYPKALNYLKVKEIFLRKFPCIGVKSSSQWASGCPPWSDHSGHGFSKFLSRHNKKANLVWWRPPKTVIFQRGEYTKPMALMDCFSHETDGFWWVLEFFFASKNQAPGAFISANTVDYSTFMIFPYTRCPFPQMRPEVCSDLEYFVAFSCSKFVTFFWNCNSVELIFHFIECFDSFH